MENNLIDKIKNISELNFNEVVEIRRYLHKYPEISFNEEKTSAFIISKLEQYGINNCKRYAKNGIIAHIEGVNPSSKIIALRADIDALPIQEQNNSDYCSVNDGVMHACGHDAHTASLLGTAKILTELKSTFEGTIKLIFQPAEEKLPGGAKLMIDEGALDNPKPDIIIGQHVMPDYETGKVGFKSGVYMASTDEIYLTISGKGGHAATPKEVTDTVLIASKIIVATKNFVSSTPTSEPTILSYGKVIANGATNIIPNEVRVEGTFRAFNETWRKEVHLKINEIVAQIAKEHGGKCEIEIIKGYPFLINDKKITENAIDFASQYIGNENIIDMDVRMTAEDFAYYTQLYPSTFYRLGIRKKGDQIDPLHSSTFDIDEESLKIGMGLMAWLAVSFLNQK